MWHILRGLFRAKKPLAVCVDAVTAQFNSGAIDRHIEWIELPRPTGVHV